MASSLTGSRGAAGNVIPKGYAAGQLQQFTPEQLNLFKSLFPHVSPGSQLSGMASGDLSSFAPQEEQAMRKFQELQGLNASRFSGMGLGARRGSGFQNSQNQATQDFGLALSSKRNELQRQALIDLLGLSESLLGQHPFKKFLSQKPQKQSFWQQLLGSAAPGLGHAAGMLPFLF